MCKAVCLLAICAIGIVTASCYRLIPASAAYTVTGVVRRSIPKHWRFVTVGPADQIALGPATASKRSRLGGTPRIAVCVRRRPVIAGQGTLVADQVPFRPRSNTRPDDPLLLSAQRCTHPSPAASSRSCSPPVPRRSSPAFIRSADDDMRR
jgi:hypothetical protein